jgi:hypothetical protein
MFEQLDINAAGPVATVKGALNKAQLASLVGMVGGGGGGGDGGP